MESINRLVIDLSVYNDVQSFTTLKAQGIYGIIHKASEGRTFRDRTYQTRRKAAADAGLLFGAYHFGNDSDVHAQVGNFLAAAEPDEDTLLALDYESNGNHTMGLEQCREFLSLVRDMTGRSPVLYSGNLIKEQLGTKIDLGFTGYRLWLAQYGVRPVSQISWAQPWLWQYTDGEHGPQPHIVSGIGGQVDCNSFNGTSDELKIQWSGKS